MVRESEIAKIRFLCRGATSPASISNCPHTLVHTPSYTLLDQNRPNSSEPQRNSEMISAVLRYRLLQLLLKSRVHQGIWHQGICLRFLKCPLISVSFLKFTDGPPGLVVSRSSEYLKRDSTPSFAADVSARTRRERGRSP